MPRYLLIVVVVLDKLFVTLDWFMVWCHLEFTPFELPALIEHSTEQLEVGHEHEFVQSEDEILAMETSRMNHLLHSFS